ncbi:uncharacterized protein LOC141605058 [Silene latifolia]|uniref:uncharacterized protein LOC141605058 n=1 Tax=Silene latifolia TaxID=37657 RepID=UPI003D76C1CB
MMDSTNNNSFSKTICSICYEDLKPIVEDLQAISICGHVFHELCLQQWFGYCTGSKKQTCPVCKQGCTKKNVGRLYFQSLGDSVLTQCQSENTRINRGDGGDCPEILRIEVKRLESKVSNLSSALDLQQNEVKKLIDELHVCKEQLSKEVFSKNEALRQRESIQAILQTKSSDLARTTAECSRLQEKNTALVRELAAVKLASDCNLGEEEILKLASVGSEGNMQEAINVLKKSLVIRNKSYKDLMAKCNTLGRGEARFQRKLEKAKEKIVKLKINIQELESTIEAKDNEVLRLLKASNTRSCNDVPISNSSKNSSSTLKHSSLEEKRQFSPPVINLDDDGDTSPFKANKTGKDDTIVSKCHDDGRSIQGRETTHYECLVDEECEILKPSASDTCTNFRSSTEESNPKCGEPASTGLRNDLVNECSTSKETAKLNLQDIRQIQPSVHTPAASSFIPLVEPGDRCFAGGLMGPDGANMYLGKWCKRVQNNAPKGSMPGSSNGTDSLIAVGGDGRGGKVKVLRPFNQTSMDPKESVVSAKRFKPGSKPNSLQSHGCLQIEHFFGKARS